MGKPKQLQGFPLRAGQLPRKCDLKVWSRKHWVTLEEAGCIIGVSRNSVGKLMDSRRLPSVWVGNRHWTRRGAVLKIAAQHEERVARQVQRGETRFRQRMVAVVDRLNGYSPSIADSLLTEIERLCATVEETK